jgi:hypothetical protein
MLFLLLQGALAAGWGLADLVEPHPFLPFRRWQPWVLLASPRTVCLSPLELLFLALLLL